MRTILNKSIRPYGAILTACSLLVLVFGVVLATHANAASPTPASGERLISIHEAGQTRGILTRATTLRQAFAESKIQVDPNDLIEPGLDSSLTASSYSVNVYRARPVTIIDGSVRQKVMSPYQTARQIVEHAQITLQDEDQTVVNANTDIVSQGAGLQLTIQRATPLSFVLYGKHIDAYTQAKTVDEMLKQKHITLGKDDTLSVPVATPISAGMTVELWRNGKQTVSEDQTIAFPVEQIQDADQPTGYKSVTTPGEDGKKTVSYEIEMKNGQELSRNEIQSVVTKEPKKQVEVIGTKVSLPPGSHQDWMAAAGISSSDYGFVDYIVSHEGGWCPTRWQGDSGCVDHGSAPQSSGYGIVQATPGVKMASAGGDWLTNPITQLRWATGYAVGRYGSWGGAYNYWTSHHNW
jgi:uncharacterized protein YabE (DUF348 family)